MQESFLGGEEMKWLVLIFICITFNYLYFFLEKKIVNHFQITNKHDWHSDSITEHKNGKRILQVLFILLNIDIILWADTFELNLFHLVFLFLALSQFFSFVTQWIFEKHTRQYILTASFFVLNILLLFPVLLVLKHFYN
jgi:hypothetical protein